MTLFDGARLTNATFRLDIEGLRRGYYADKYFANVAQIMDGLDAEGYTFAGRSPRSLPLDPSGVSVSRMVVEAQIFNRRAPRVLVVGTDVALAMLRHATGHFEGEHFVETWRELDVEAVDDGVFTRYAGDPQVVEPVLKIRGRYRDFGILETTMLGVLSRASRIATNAYEVLEVSNGKPVLFFPARFDVPEVQAIDGYAYRVAVQRHNHDTGRKTQPHVSTDAQGAWWGGSGGGTTPHALIACFLGDTAESMVAFARHLPLETPRIALTDFDNDTVRAALATLSAFWSHYRAAYENGDEQAQRRWTLAGVRLDTGGNVRDTALPPDAPTGVSPVLVRAVRAALDRAWEAWDVPDRLRDVARDYCRGVKIVATGGFNRERIQQFEQDNVPVDIYGVGSALFQSDSRTNSDYTMDVVRVKVNDIWVDMAKVGRRPCDNPALRPVDLSRFQA